MSPRRPLLLLFVLVLPLLAVMAAACGKGGGPLAGSSGPTASDAPSVALPPGALPLPGASQGSMPPSLAQGAPAPAIVTSEGIPISFAPLARRADPAVATVNARVEKETRSGRKRAVSEGLGTAFVSDPEGFMLTNNHGIEDATDIVVGFPDGREMRATDGTLCGAIEQVGSTRVMARVQGRRGPRGRTRWTHRGSSVT